MSVDIPDTRPICPQCRLHRLNWEECEKCSCIPADDLLSVAEYEAAECEAPEHCEGGGWYQCESWRCGAMFSESQIEETR